MAKGDMIATREAYGKALVSLAEEYKDLVVLDADLSGSTKTAAFAEKYPERFFEMGIAEQDMLGTAAGLAAAGKKPFASTFAIFASGRAWEQVRNSIAYAQFNVKIAATHAGVTVGEDGASHQAIEDIALMRVIPGMTVVIPADAVETEQAVKALLEYDGPAYLRLGRSKVPVVMDDDYQFQLGKAATMREGDAVTIIACGIMVDAALTAAEELAGEGISARVLNMSTIKPLDEEAVLKAAKETRAIVTCEEHSIIGGLGSAVAECVVKSYPVPMRFVGVKDRFGQSGSPAELVKEYGLTAGDIVRAVKEVLAAK
ncbi:MAG: transketolase family protein [Firmicutes bacterium]|nr:transketolase family protein [Bacillota bacterium]